MISPSPPRFILVFLRFKLTFDLSNFNARLIFRWFFDSFSDNSSVSFFASKISLFLSSSSLLDSSLSLSSSSPFSLSISSISSPSSFSSADNFSLFICSDIFSSSSSSSFSFDSSNSLVLSLLYFPSLISFLNPFSFSS